MKSRQIALLRGNGHDVGARLGRVAREHGGVLSLDGLQPDQGYEQLWVMREVQRGTIVAAANLQQASTPCDPADEVVRDSLPALRHHPRAAG